MNEKTSLNQNDLEPFKGRNVFILIPARYCRTFENKNFGKVIKYLHTQGAHISIYMTSTPEDRHFKATYPNSTIYDGFSRTNSLIRSLWNVWAALHKAKPDIILWTYAGYRENLVFSLSRFFGGPPFVVKSDSVAPDRRSFRSLRNKLAGFLFYIFPAKMASLVIVETKDVEKKAQALTPSGSFFLFPNGVPVSQFKKFEASFQRKAAPAPKPYFLYTGRILHSKGTDILVRAFAKIADKIPAWHTHIVGEVWDKDHESLCRQLIAEFRLEDRVTFHPFATGEDYYQWYHHADVFVCPSRGEGLANRLPEAMFFKKSIVAFDVGQTRELVNNDTGILVPPLDENTFAEAMLKLALNPEMRTKLGQNGRRMVETKFNDDELIPSLILKCQNFLPGRRRAS